MRELINIFQIIVTVTLLTCCIEDDHSENGMIESEVRRYGWFFEGTEHLISRIDLRHFDSYVDLLNRVEEIVCNDSIPTILLNDDLGLIELRISSPCWTELGCILIRSRNILKVINEEIHRGSIIYPVSLLEERLSMHYHNCGNRPDLSESPADLIISIAYEGMPITGLSNLLIRLVDSHNLHKVDRPIKIWLTKMIPPPPPPPMTLH